MIHRSAARAARVSVLGLVLTLLAGLALAQEQIVENHGFTEFGELKYPRDLAHFDYVNPQAPKGGEISLAAVGTFDSMNPFARSGRAGALASEQYETLMVASYDEPGSYYGLIAESLEYPETQDWVIFNLRPEARFSDGTPVTAEDVAFSHEIFLEQGLPSYRDAVRKRIPKVEVLGPHRVKFHFTPGISRRSLITQVANTSVLSKAWFQADPEKRRIDEPRMDPGIGSGPYVLESVDINQRIVYRRNPDYWGADLNVNVGRHNYDRIRIEYFGDSIAAMEGFKAGVFTVRPENSSKNWGTGYDFEAVHNGSVVKASLPDGSLAAPAGFVMNLTRPVFQDIRVREAVQLAFNFDWTNASLQYGLFSQRHSFWQDTELQAKGVPEGREKEVLTALGDLIAPSVLTEPPVMAHESDAARALDRRNLRRAMKLLDDAGWTVGDDGLRRNAEGKVLAIEFLIDSPVTARVVDPFVANLTSMGIQAELNRVDNAQFTSRRRDKDFDMIFAGFPLDLEPSTELYQLFGSEAHSYSVFNPAGLADAAVDALIENIVAATTKEELYANTRALDRVLRAKRFMVPVWYLDVHWIAYWDFYEYPETLPPFSLGLLDLWWINSDKLAALKASGALR